MVRSERQYVPRTAQDFSLAKTVRGETVDLRNRIIGIGAGAVGSLAILGWNGVDLANNFFHFLTPLVDTIGQTGSMGLAGAGILLTAYSYFHGKRLKHRAQEIAAHNSFSSDNPLPDLINRRAALHVVGTVFTALEIATALLSLIPVVDISVPFLEALEFGVEAYALTHTYRAGREAKKQLKAAKQERRSH